MLQAFLRDRACRRFVWGENDCGMWLADWCAIAGRPVDIAAWRGRYASEAQALSLLPWGGVPRLFDRIARAARLARTRMPALGDVAVLRDPQAGALGAIRTTARWALLGEGVLTIPAASARIIVAWEI